MSTEDQEYQKYLDDFEYEQYLKNFNKGPAQPAGLPTYSGPKQEHPSLLDRAGQTAKDTLHTANAFMSGHTSGLWNSGAPMVSAAYDKLTGNAGDMSYMDRVKQYKGGQEGFNASHPALSSAAAVAGGIAPSPMNVANRIVGGISEGAGKLIPDAKNVTGVIDSLKNYLRGTARAGVTGGASAYTGTAINNAADTLTGGDPSKQMSPSAAGTAGGIAGMGLDSLIRGSGKLLSLVGGSASGMQDDVAEAYVRNPERAREANRALNGKNPDPQYIDRKANEQLAIARDNMQADISRLRGQKEQALVGTRARMQARDLAPTGISEVDDEIARLMALEGQQPGKQIQVPVAERQAVPERNWMSAENRMALETGAPAIPPNARGIKAQAREAGLYGTPTSASQEGYMGAAAGQPAAPQAGQVSSFTQQQEGPLKLQRANEMMRGRPASPAPGYTPETGLEARGAQTVQLPPEAPSSVGMTGTQLDRLLGKAQANTKFTSIAPDPAQVKASGAAKDLGTKLSKAQRATAPKVAELNDIMSPKLSLMDEATNMFKGNPSKAIASNGPNIQQLASKLDEAGGSDLIGLNQALDAAKAMRGSSAGGIGGVIQNTGKKLGRGGLILGDKFERNADPIIQKLLQGTLGLQTK